MKTYTEEIKAFAAKEYPAEVVKYAEGIRKTINDLKEEQLQILEERNALRAKANRTYGPAADAMENQIKQLKAKYNEVSDRIKMNSEKLASPSKYCHTAEIDNLKKLADSEKLVLEQLQTESENAFRNMDKESFDKVAAKISKTQKKINEIENQIKSAHTDPYLKDYRELLNEIKLSAAAEILQHAEAINTAINEYTKEMKALYAIIKRYDATEGEIGYIQFDYHPLFQARAAYEHADDVVLKDLKRMIDRKEGTHEDE